MGRRCIVRNCDGGKNNNKSEGTSTTLFSVPKDQVLFDAWKSNLPELRKPFSTSCYVCEKHFHPSDILSHYTHKLPTNMWTYSRGLKQLKPKAVPVLLNSSLTSDNTMLHDQCHSVEDVNHNQENIDIQIESPVDTINLSENQLCSPSISNEICTSNDDIMEVQEIQVKQHSVDTINSSKNKLSGPGISNEICTSNDDIMEVQEIQVPFTFNYLMKNLDNLTYPEGCRWSYTITSNKQTIIFVSSPSDGILRRVDIYSNLSTKVIMDCICVAQEHLPKRLKSLEEITEFLTEVYDWNLCLTLKNSKRFIHDAVCEAIAPLNENNLGRPRLSCMPCALRRESEQRKNIQQFIQEKKPLRQRTLNQKVRRYKQKIVTLEGHVDDLWCKFKNIEEKTLENAIVNLKESQKTLIRACLESAKKNGQSKSGIRYDIKWIYQCLLIRIKGPGLYDSLRKNETLPLPSRQTLRKYISSFDHSFGFQKSIFEALKLKNLSKPTYERRGVLLIDEIALSKMVTFDQKTLDFLGFVGLGDHTPNNQKGQIGDHALVFMFQPFRGPWVQTLGCFLAKGATPSDTLKELTLECVTKVEDAGLFVDAVTTDGASWNRAMWTKLNIDDNHVFCTHPCDEKRKLWFISDFPHLIKNLRNRVVEKKIFKSPSGVIQLSHWENVLKADNPLEFNLKVCPGLSHNVIHPKPFQKMNVRRAFRFFGIAEGMELFKEQGIAGLEDANPTIQFIKIIHNLIGIMNSKTPGRSLKWDTNDRKDLENFLKYLDDWEEIIKEEARCDKVKNMKTKQSITNSTLIGLRVTVKATLEIHEYLSKLEGDNLSSLMTCRLNQDALERFFSIVRSAGGNNTHPTPVSFAQIFRLLSVYSLIKPPKGSNVDSNETVVALLNPEDVKSKKECSGREKLKLQIESILEQQPTGADTCDNESDDTFNFIVEPFDHDYVRKYSGDEVKSYVSGYIARKIIKFTKCDDCIRNLTTDESENRDKLIELKTKGKLLIPSKKLFQTISIAEDLILSNVYEEDLTNNFLSKVFSDMEETKFPSIGCDDHDLRSKILSFFIIFRMNTLCNRYNDIYLSSKREETQMHTKIAKLK